jgi:hypothetical protein
MHPTQKPVIVQGEIIEMFTKPGDVVLDLYAGSGPTLLAAHHLGRRAIVAELSPSYLAVILERGVGAGLIPKLLGVIGPDGVLTPADAQRPPMTPPPPAPDDAPPPKKTRVKKGGVVK